jgi:hypothetical protein
VFVGLLAGRDRNFAERVLLVPVNGARPSLAMAAPDAFLGSVATITPQLKKDGADGGPKAEVAEQALARLFDPESAAGLEAGALTRMDRFDIRQGRIESDLALNLETLSHFVFYWLTRTDPIPETERQAAHALGLRRLDHFMGQVKRKVIQRSRK